MKLYVKQKVFSWVDKFSIYDYLGNELYSGKGKFFTISKKLDIYDSNNNHKAHIHKKVFSFLPRYFIEINGEEVAQVVKKITLFKKKFTISGLDWEVEGDFLDHEYEIYHNGDIIAMISKEWFAFGDAYSVDIADDLDPVPILSVVLIIDSVLGYSHNRASVSVTIGQ